MPFLPPNQQCQSTEDLVVKFKLNLTKDLVKLFAYDYLTKTSIDVADVVRSDTRPSRDPDQADHAYQPSPHITTLGYGSSSRQIGCGVRMVRTARRHVASAIVHFIAVICAVTRTRRHHAIQSLYRLNTVYDAVFRYVSWICRERTAKTVNCCNYSYFV